MKNLQELSLAHLLPMFPPAEREMLMLWLGRIGTPSERGLSVVLCGEPRAHRTMFLDRLVTALSHSDYVVSLWGHPHSNSSADLVYLDNMTAPQLRSALGSTLLNSLANNLEFQTEIKPKCAVIINSALKADQIAKLGVGFDLRFLSTYDASELPTGFDICEYYSDLANQLGVGPHAPLQWLCQLAIDRFKAYAKADLDAEIQRITRKLRIRK